MKIMRLIVIGFTVAVLSACAPKIDFPENELGVFKSEDKGISWTQINFASHDHDLNKILIENVNSFSMWTFGSILNPVPVELVLFLATVSGTKVLLEWETATEVNNYGFDIERRSSSNENVFRKIGFIEGHGNSKTAARYDYALRLERWMNHFLKDGGEALPPYELDHAARLLLAPLTLHLFVVFPRELKLVICSQ